MSIGLKLSRFQYINQRFSPGTEQKIKPCASAVRMRMMMSSDGNNTHKLYIDIVLKSANFFLHNGVIIKYAIPARRLEMRALFLPDEVMRLHWAVLKSVLMILLVIPLSHTLLQIVDTVEDSAKIMVLFFAISLISSSIILAFAVALRMTIWQVMLDMNAAQRLLVKVYRQVPMLFFTAVTLVGLLKHQLTI
jgi:hypothetical protein